MSRVGNEISILKEYLSTRLEVEELDKVCDILETIEILNDACLKNKSKDETKVVDNYYLVTYQAQRVRNFEIGKSQYTKVWIDVINESPISFIKFMNNDSGLNFRDFVLLNSVEISKEEFEEWKD